MTELSKASPRVAIDWVRHMRQALITFALVFITAYGSIVLTRGDLAIAPIWPANALLLVFALRSPWSPAWRLDLLAAAGAAAILANHLGGSSLALSAWFTLANSAEVIAAFMLIRYAGGAARGDGRQILRRLRQLLFTALAAPVISASIAAFALGLLEGFRFRDAFADWYISAALGMLIILPLGIIDYRDSLKRLTTAAGMRSAVIVFLAAIATAFVVFGQTVSPFSFSVPIVILLATYFHRSIGAAVALTTVAVIAVWLTAQGHGPLSIAQQYDEKGRQFLLQAFLMANSILAAISAAILDDRDALRMMAERRESEARAASNAQAELLKSVAHEIRTPLNVIQGLGDLLRQRQYPAAEAKTMLTAIVESAAEIQALANDLLDRSRVERGALRLQPSSFPVAGVFDELKTEFDAAHIDGRLVFSPAGADVIWADRPRTKQMLRNLILNAVKYAGLYGPIRISSHPAKPAGYTRLEVIDQGPGIPKHQLSEAFEPFSSLGPKRASDKSAGVGLSLVKQLAEAQHGAVGASSLPFVETRFWIELPSEPSSEARAAYAQVSDDIDPRSVFPD